MRKSSPLSSGYRPGTSRKPVSLDTFRQQMADFARGELLARLRDAKHMSRENVAAEIGVTAKSLYAWEHGGKIKWENAKRIAEFYNVAPETLVSRDGEAPAVSESLDEASQLDRIEAKLNRLLELAGVDVAEIEEAAAESLREIEAQMARLPQGDKPRVGKPRPADTKTAPGQTQVRRAKTARA